MSHLQILDTFPDFLRFWENAHSQPMDRQIEGWADEYLAAYPELLAKQIEDYSSQNVDWRTIAKEKVFPFLEERLPAMQEARQNLLDACPPIYEKAQRMLGFESDAIFVIHVGIGCGAGWVTPFDGQPAILFGLENVAECGWSDALAIAGLVSHEIGHVLHFHWRKQHGKTLGEGAWWQLYEEGFAQRCETLIHETEAWHQQDPDDDWLDWCQSHRGWLAAEFLKTVEAGKPVNPFFGSWFDIEGKSETGYFLGHEVIRELEKEYNLTEIALLENIEPRLRAILQQMQN